jgi:hypothetical protein
MTIGLMIKSSEENYISTIHLTSRYKFHLLSVMHQYHIHGIWFRTLHEGIGRDQEREEKSVCTQKKSRFGLMVIFISELAETPFGPLQLQNAPGVFHRFF